MKKLSIFLMMLCFACFGVANAQQSLPYSYGFENYDLSADGWTTANPYSSNTSEFGINTAAKHNGDYGFRFSSYSRNNAGYDQYLISPELDGARGVIMSFWYAASSTSGTELFKVGYSTTDMNISSFTWGNEISTNSTSWTQSEEFMFPAGTKYVAIWYYSNYQYRLYVDDFSFSAVPSCVKPTLSNEVILGMDNASVQWTENGTATNWELQYSTNADFSGATTINRSGIPVYAIRELSAATTYYARVRANCGGGDYSDWSNVITFTTWACENATAVEYNLTDSYGDGWNGNAIRIFDGCGDLVETLTIASGSTNSGTLSLCGDYYQFVWHTGSYASETSFTLTVNGTALYSQQSGGSLTDGQVLHTIGIQPPVMPTDLTAGTPGANEVQLSWTENGTATTWQICINDDEDNLVVANSNPFTLTGLNAVTAYTVKVRSTDGTSASCWSNVVSFTTDSSCPTPTNLTATNVMPTSATLNWEGEAESYNVRYGMAGGEVTIFEDGFENGLDNWTTYTMGDAPAWRTTDPSEGLSWSGHNGSTNVAISMSWNNDSYTADNWLVTPQVQLGGTLKFYVYTNQSYPDDYEVKLSTSGNSISNFTVTLQELASIPTTGDWVEVNIDLSSYEGQNGYIAIHHSYYDGNYILVDDFGIYATQDAGEWINATSTTNSLDITGLSSLKNYEFQVQAVCGTDDESGWSDIANFPTPDGCAVPTDLTADVTGNAAELSWTGAQENYNVRYRKGFVYDFESAEPWTITDFSPCTVYDGDQAQCYGFSDETFTNIPFTGSTIAFQSQSGNLSSHSGNAFGMMVSALPSQYPDGITHSDDWFILPEITIANGDVFSFWGREITTQYGAETINVGIYGNTAGTFAATIAGNVAVNSTEWTEFSYDLSAYAGQTIKLAINYVSNDIFGFMFDDIFVGNPNWSNLIAVTGSTYTLENLDSQSTYLWQVQGVDCDGNGGNTDWSASATFTTPEFYTKTIQAVGAEAWAEGKGGYYLIASPLANNVAPTNVAGMITDNLGANVDETTSTYDLYSFDQAETDEWRNYRANTFELVNGQGYLYASKEGTELVFTGAGNSNNTQDVTLSMATASDGLDFPDWNLVGNPFAKDNAYLSDGRAFYSMQNSGVYTPQSGPVAIGPMEGVFVVANFDEETLTFTTTQPNSKVAQLTLNLTKTASAGSTLLDRAIVRFDEGSQLPKLQFRNGSTKVYIPLEGKDYAVVRSEAMGTMPVNFKAENNGSYTLSVNAEDVNFAYLHLIDNMNGNDVDLLANPSYSFDAKTSDYESRFKLVFAAGNSNDDAFAFYSNGSFVINNEGNATLQVIDVNGRILKSESINGCANVNVNAAQGIYMLRLVNGDNVKVQKVVVR